MTKVVVHPSTMEGIKRLARSLKRQKSISHLKALDEAAQLAGFQSFKHAQNQLPVPGMRESQGPRRHPAYLTAYWRTEEGATGRETLLIHTRYAGRSCSRLGNSLPRGCARSGSMLRTILRPVKTCAGRKRPKR